MNKQLIKCSEQKIAKLRAEIDKMQQKDSGNDPVVLLGYRMGIVEAALEKLEAKVDDFTSKLLYAVLILAGVIAGTKLI